MSKTLHRQGLLKYGVIVGGIVLGLVALSYVGISRTINNSKEASSQKVLTTTDLENPNVKLDSTTSDASVGNLEKELKAKIDKQIAAKENPFDTVNQLAGVLANTTNKTRPNQAVDFLEGFLTEHKNALSFPTEDGTPDQAQVNYWTAKLYAKLVYAYQFMMANKFTGSDGKTIDTTKEQLKYIDLYLAIAQDRNNWGEPQISEEDGHTWYLYSYEHTSDFIDQRKQLGEDSRR